MIHAILDFSAMFFQIMSIWSEVRGQREREREREREVWLGYAWWIVTGVHSIGFYGSQDQIATLLVIPIVVHKKTI